MLPSCAIYPSFDNFLSPLFSLSISFLNFSIILYCYVRHYFSSSGWYISFLYIYLIILSSSLLFLFLFSSSLFIVINHSSGKLGRPVIQIEGVTFGYASKNETKYPSLPLFADVHLGIEQSSRIALVGPNGSGKVRGHYIIGVLDVRMYYCSAINLNIFFRK